MFMENELLVSKSTQDIKELVRPSTIKSAHQRKKSKQKKGWTVDIKRTHYKVFKEVVEKDLKWKIYKDNKETEPDIIWTDFYVSEDEVYNLSPFQKINHFPSSFQLGNKSFLTKNISKMKKKYPNQYKFQPESWQLPQQIQLFKYQKDKKRTGTWIMKPANLCQGKGIIINNNIDFLQQKVKHSRKQYVVQKYIDNPYLINNLKFDLRLYVLVQSLKPLQIFLYKDGLARFATTVYQKPTKTNLTDNFMHLTNYSINKKNPTFSDQEETGHKRKLSTLLDSMAKDGIDINQLMSKICQSIVYTIISVQPMLSHLYSASAPSKFAKGKNCFEIFGFDFLVDTLLEPYLLEVNHTPSFKISSEVDKQIKTNLIKDTFLHLYNKSKKTQVFTGDQVWDTIDSLKYVQIYPTKTEPDKYAEVIDHSQSLFDKWTGVKKVVKQQSVCPENKFFESQKKTSNMRLRLHTADSQSHSPIDKKLRKTMTTLQRPFCLETAKIMPTRIVINQNHRTMSAYKKSSLNQTMINSQQKRSACIVYDFIQKNIDLEIMEPQVKQAFSTKKTRAILLKSFNSKQYKNIKSKQFREEKQKQEKV